jgi:hypothetical protein
VSADADELAAEGSALSLESCSSQARDVLDASGSVVFRSFRCRSQCAPRPDAATAGERHSSPSRHLVATSTLLRKCSTRQRTPRRSAFSPRIGVQGRKNVVRKSIAWIDRNPKAIDGVLLDGSTTRFEEAEVTTKGAGHKTSGAVASEQPTNYQMMRRSNPRIVIPEIPTALNKTTTMTSSGFMNELDSVVCGEDSGRTTLLTRLPDDVTGGHLSVLNGVPREESCDTGSHQVDACMLTGHGHDDRDRLHDVSKRPGWDVGVTKRASGMAARGIDDDVVIGQYAAASSASAESSLVASPSPEVPAATTASAKTPKLAAAVGKRCRGVAVALRVKAAHDAPPWLRQQEVCHSQSI